MFVPDVNEVMKVRLDLINSSTPINTPPSPEARASCQANTSQHYCKLFHECSERQADGGRESKEENRVSLTQRTKIEYDVIQCNVRVP
jgi:hypothetical protein